MKKKLGAGGDMEGGVVGGWLSELRGGLIGREGNLFHVVS